MFWPCETRTSTCRNFATISSGLYRFLVITVLLDVKDIPQVGPLQWGRINARACSALDRSGFLLTVIDTDGARAGETLCAFESKRQTKLGWDVVARCSNSHERWTANVSLSVKDNRQIGRAHV